MNNHFIVLELGPDVQFSYASHKAVTEYKEAKALGVETVPVFVGPDNYLLFSKPAKGVSIKPLIFCLFLIKSFQFTSMLLFPNHFHVLYNKVESQFHYNKNYPCREVIVKLKEAGATWIQVDEATLVKDLEGYQLEAFTKAYSELESACSGLNVIVATYFAEAFKTLTSLPGVVGFTFDADTCILRPLL
ncbi:unnamed protein product [Lactuca virosa]|uniref:Cobalamin-independent methionine synthase MetE N-terminal domain-containing protein n=1 Tax=Lactuca virosa TaxID=75947 RepID=A0AAU9M4T2_9ASTR|nr:unnamed protein product [Lactuca virosa]